MAAQIVPLPILNKWGDELFEEFNRKIEILQTRDMDKLESITEAI